MNVTWEEQPSTGSETKAAETSRRELPIHPCFACGTQNFGSGDFAHFSIRADYDGVVSVPLGSTYKVNMPKGSHLCATCFSMALDGHVPNLTVEKMYPVECQICKERFESALPHREEETPTQGFDCSCFYYPQGNLIHGAWGSRKYDDKALHISSSMPLDVLNAIQPIDPPICDHCIGTWIKNGWLSPKL